MNKLPGINSLPRHPVFEIAEQSPVFLVNDRVYSVGGGKVSDGKDYFEKTKTIRSRRNPLVEVGDFASLDALVLDRASKEIERIGENYARDAQRKLNVLRRLDSDLDTPQLIYKFIFPYLHNGQYGDKVSELLGVEEIRGTSKSPEQKAKVTRRLEQIADEVGIEVRNLIGQIEQEGQKPTERTKKQSRLDSLFDYEESKPYTGTSLLGRAINGRNVAIVDGIVYDLITGRDGQKQHVQVDGQRFFLVEREEPKREPKTGFEVGDKIRMNAKASKKYPCSKEGSEGVIKRYTENGEFDIKLTGRDTDVSMIFNVHRKYMENLEEIAGGDRAGTTRNLEERFLTELEKKIRVDALRQHLSRDKIIDLLRTQDAELLAMAGRKEYQGEGFGFVQDGEENYYAYLEVPAFARKSDSDGNYYFFDKSRIGTRVWKNGNKIKYDIDFVMIDNNNHPLLNNFSDSGNRRKKFIRICFGYNTFPTSGKDMGEVIARRLQKAGVVLRLGFRKNYVDFYTHQELGKCIECRVNHYKTHIRSQKELEKLGVPIINGGERR